MRNCHHSIYRTRGNHDCSDVDRLEKSTSVSPLLLQIRNMPSSKGVIRAQRKKDINISHRETLIYDGAEQLGEEESS